MTQPATTVDLESVRTMAMNVRSRHCDEGGDVGAHTLALFALDAADAIGQLRQQLADANTVLVDRHEDCDRLVAELAAARRQRDQLQVANDHVTARLVPEHHRYSVALARIRDEVYRFVQYGDYKAVQDFHARIHQQACDALLDSRSPDPGLPEHLRGDGPCGDCGTTDNIVWFTESVFWNEIVRKPNDGYCGILCIPCFVKRVDVQGYHPTGWRLLPEWHWETTAEYEARRATREATSSADRDVHIPAAAIEQERREIAQALRQRARHLEEQEIYPDAQVALDEAALEIECGRLRAVPDGK